MKFICYLAVFLLCLSLLCGCDTVPEQYREYKYDLYSPSGELFTVVTVRSASTPQILDDYISGESPSATGKTIVRSRGLDSSQRSGDVKIPAGWLIVEHGKQVGQ